MLFVQAGKVFLVMLKVDFCSEKTRKKNRLVWSLDQGVDLALLDDEGRKRSAAVNNTYPGWSGTPGLKFNEKRCGDAIVIQLEECHCRFGIST